MSLLYILMIMGFNPFVSNSTQSVSWLVLIALVAMYPRDAIALPAYVAVRMALIALNCFLMFQAWRIYRQIRKDFVRLGLSPPAFHYTPIWDR